MNLKFKYPLNILNVNYNGYISGEYFTNFNNESHFIYSNKIYSSVGRAMLASYNFQEHNRYIDMNDFIINDMLEINNQLHSFIFNVTNNYLEARVVAVILMETPSYLRLIPIIFRNQTCPVHKNLDSYVQNQNKVFILENYIAPVRQHLNFDNRNIITIEDKLKSGM